MVKKVELKSEALTRGVLQKACNNFTKSTVKHLCFSLFLIKLQTWWCAALSRKKTPAQVEHNFFSFFFFCLVEHVRTDAWVKWTKKIAFANSIHRKTLVMASFLVQLQTCGLTDFPRGNPSQMLFCENCVEFYRTSFLQNNAARLLLISCNIFNVSLTLSVKNQFSHSMGTSYWYYISIISALILVLILGIILVLL